MSGIPIYQFCRGFDNVRESEVYKCHVSGGYAFDKIARENKEIPPEIRKAVMDDYFKLNDNYPPETGDFALIARELNDKYSVLAVANRQLDDGGRPTIGYKYFWLKKSSSDVDGIGTLIYWWRDNQSQFKMSELVETSPQPIFEYQDEEAKINFYLQANWLEDTRKTVNKLEEIPRTSVVTKDYWQGLPPYIKLHYLALGLSLRANHTNSPNAWAWNVQKLAHPDSFISIFYTTQEDIPSNIRKRNLPPLAKSPTLDKAQPENPTPLSSKTSNSIPPAVEKNIKSFLSSLANTVNQNGLDEKIQELFGYLRDYADADWTNCIDKTRVTASSPHEIYPQLIYLVAPNNKSSENWLLKMVKSLEIDTKKISPRILEFQRFLLEASVEYEDPLVNERLVFSIYAGISYLLNQLIYTKNGNHQIEFLLTQSQSVWSRTFLDYAELVKKRIFSKEKTIVEESMETFCQEILTLLERPQNISLAERKQYKKLASTFIKINYYSLAGTFYYISDKYIPPIINDTIDHEILRKIHNIKSHKTDSLSKNNNEPQANKSKGDESKETDHQNDESRSNEPKDNPIPYQPTQYNPIQNEDNTQVSILCMSFLVFSIIFKTCESIIRPNQIFLLPISIIYSIFSLIVIYLTLHDFFHRRNRRFNRIIGSSLAIIYICIFVAMIWQINIIPVPKANPSQLATQQTQKSTSTNSATPSTSNISSGCSTDVFSNLEVFKACNNTDKDKLEVELRTKYNLFSTAIGENLRTYYLSSKDENQFQERKLEIENCQKDNPITDTGNNDKRVDCIKRTIDKSKQPKKL